MEGFLARSKYDTSPSSFRVGLGRPKTPADLASRLSARARVAAARPLRSPASTTPSKETSLLDVRRTRRSHSARSTTRTLSLFSADTFRHFSRSNTPSYPPEPQGMFARLATRSSARQSLRTLSARGYASAAPVEAGGPSFELTEEQVGIRELTRNFTVSVGPSRDLLVADVGCSPFRAGERDHPGRGKV